jgi:uncharacterized protein YdeI (YjbR/CyaY-like superfamily)
MSRADPRVDAYIEAAAPFAQPLLRTWRGWMAHPEVSEAIKWGMPHFVYKGKLIGGMAAFKAHCAFGFWATEVEARGEKAMGQFGRVRSAAGLPKAAEVQALLKAALAAIDAGGPLREKRARREPLATPEALRAALQRDGKAAAFFASLPPSAQRDYNEWIAEAKQEATRERRVAQALEWLAEGKRRHWKYERC